MGKQSNQQKRSRPNSGYYCASHVSLTVLTGNNLKPRTRISSHDTLIVAAFEYPFSITASTCLLSKRNTRARNWPESSYPCFAEDLWVETLARGIVRHDLIHEDCAHRRKDCLTAGADNTK